MVSTLLLLGLFVAVVALAALATWTRLPYAVLLVLGGLALGFMPGLPMITLNPNLVLLLFLPPLVYSSAWLTSWREFRTSLRPILLLAVGLVLATTVVVAVRRSCCALACPGRWPLCLGLWCLRPMRSPPAQPHSALGCRAGS